MKNSVLSSCLLVFWFCGVGCNSHSKKPIDSPSSRILTLPWRQLLSLDWQSPDCADDRVRVMDKRIFMFSPAVEFDIYFPNNNPGNRSLNFVSSGEGGKRTLVGADIRDYEAFALKFTLVSINGRTDPEMKQKLVAGALIGPTNKGRLSTYEPVTLGMAASGKTMISKTSVSTDKLYQIGFHIHILNPLDWDQSGSMVKLQVEPVKDGEAVPQQP